jgi:hypothetical protein
VRLVKNVISDVIHVAGCFEAGRSVVPWAFADGKDAEAVIAGTERLNVHLSKCTGLLCRCNHCAPITDV